MLRPNTTVGGASGSACPDILNPRAHEELQRVNSEHLTMIQGLSAAMGGANSKFMDAMSALYDTRDQNVRVFLEAQERFRDEENRIDGVMRELVADLKKEIVQAGGDLNVGVDAIN